MWRARLRSARGARHPRGAATQDVLIVVRDGYHPALVEARAGGPLRLRFRRDESSRCSETVLLPELGRFADLPEGETVTIECGTLAPGDYDFSCPRGALHGRLVVQ
jgi:Cu+-exporting ATPase